MIQFNTHPSESKSHGAVTAHKGESGSGLRVDRFRILVPTPLYGGSLPLARHTADAFKLLGHEVRVIDFEDQYALFRRCETLKSAQQKSIPMQASIASLLADIVTASALEFGADLVWFTAQSPISQSTLKTLRSSGIKTAMWFVEDFRRFDYWKTLVEHLDAVFTIQDGEVHETMRQYGATRTFYLPAAANTRMHCPAELSPQEILRYGAEVAFVGAGYQNRVEFFQRNKIKGLRLWGNDWPTHYVHNCEEGARRLSTEETALVYRATNVNLNLHSSADDRMMPLGDFVNPRTFEIAACRAFQICDNQAPLQSMFEIGKEIIVSKEEKEIISLIEYYRARPDLRQEIAQAGYERVLREHTYQHRLASALEQLTTAFPDMRRRQNVSRFMRDLIDASSDDEEMVEYLKKRANHDCNSLADLVSGIPVGKRDLTRAEMLVLTLHEFRQWGIEKGVVS